MAANLFQGRIVRLLVPRPDPQGQNPKSGRMYVVVSDLESIKAGCDLTLIGITNSIRGTEDEVELSWANPGVKCKTGLTLPSVALCTWIEHDVPQSEVESTTGFVKPEHLRAILTKHYSH